MLQLQLFSMWEARAEYLYHEYSIDLATWRNWFLAKEVVVISFPRGWLF